jgi:hypothetical protein
VTAVAFRLKGRWTPFGWTATSTAISGASGEIAPLNSVCVALSVTSFETVS